MRGDGRAKRGRRSGKGPSIARTGRDLELLLIALPGVVLLLLFRYVPMGGLVIAFQRFRPIEGIFHSEWVGFANFRFLLSSPDLLRITRNTIVLNVVFIIVSTVVSLALSLLLFEIRSRSWIKFYQTVLFWPHFLSWVVVSYMLYAFLSMDFGIVNRVIERVGGQAILWYHEPRYWPGILTGVYTWKVLGFNCLIYYAGLLAVDGNLYEAAAIDGASKTAMTFRISLPSLAPVIVTLTTLKLGRMLYGDFGLFYVVTRNVSLLYKWTDVIDTYVYRALVTNPNIGVSSAVNLYQAVFGFALVMISREIVRRISPENTPF